MASKATFVLNFDVNFLRFISTKLSGFIVLTCCPNFWGNYTFLGTCAANDVNPYDMAQGNPGKNSYY
jgi:hypothetical protein